MKLKFLIAGAFLAGSMMLPAQNKVYLWTEVDPGWKDNALEYWGSVKGYWEKVPAEMSDLIQEYYLLAEKKLELALKDKILKSDLSASVLLTNNPGAIYLENHDFYLDLSCRLEEISDEYPNFRVRKLNIHPVLEYTLTLYNSRGDIVGEKKLRDSIDYKTKIRPLLRGMTEHRRDVEIVRYSFFESFSGDLPAQIIDEVPGMLKKAENNSLSADPEKFTRVLSLLFENRKLQHPSEYSEIQFQKSATPGRQRLETSEDQAMSTAEARITRELNSLITGSKYYALLVGINDYRDPNINDLAEPLADAKRFADILLKKYTFDEENIMLLDNPSRDELIQALDNLTYKISENDNLLIFYAGHGLWDDQLKKGFWIPSDASTDNRANWFSNSDLRDYIGGIRAKHTLLISDACFSGGIFKTREAFSGVTHASLELYKLPSRKAMTSGAMTTVPDKSVFIEYLMKRLEENTSPFLSSEQLFASFKLAVINNSPTKQVPQFGEIRETGDEGGDFLFIKRINQEE